jgi:hypothetical protein
VSVIQTLLVFGGIPLAVILLVVAAVFGRSAVHQPNRYRPGRPWTYPPAWYLPHPDALQDVVSDRVAIQGTSDGATAAGGASGEW